MGIGGEYAAINSAIDELIPARVRGRVDLIINGSYWVGAAAGALAADGSPRHDPVRRRLGWRLAFVIGATLGVGILLVRRNVPESPRWLFIHGHEEEAEEIVDEIEEQVREDTGEELSEPEGSIAVRPRERIRFGEIARTAYLHLPPPHDPRPLAVRRPGLPLQRGHLRPRHPAGRILQRRLRDDPALHRPLRRLQLPRAADPRPLLRHRRPQADGLRHLPRLGGADRRPRCLPARRKPHDLVLHGLRPGDLLPRLGRRQLRLPDRQRDLPDGDAGALDRLLLRGRHRRRGHRRAAALRPPDQHRQPVQGRDRLLRRRRRDGDRRHRRALLRRRRRAEAARGDRRAADRDRRTRTTRKTSPGAAAPRPPRRQRIRTSPGMPVSEPALLGGLRPRGRDHRPRPARARQRQPARAEAAGRRPLLGPRPLPRGAARGGARGPREAASAAASTRRSTTSAATRPPAER